MKRVYYIFSILILACSSCSGPVNQDSFVLQEATISDIQSAIAKGEISYESLTRSYIDRIESLDKSSGLNSIVIINPDAINIAKEKDLERKNGKDLPTLHGIPIIVKDNYNTIGLQTAAGSMALKGYEPETDSYIVKRLKEEGAIVLAKSNMAEWAFSPMVTISSIAGETKNPYNLNHVPAGSSGGTAAAVASNFGVAGLGTDTGNSIRGPSSHNALVGFRTTLGLVSRSGIVPLYLRNDVGGPMTRTVEDATIILDAIAGYDPDDPITKMSDGHVPDTYTTNLISKGLSGARIGVLCDLSESDINPEVKTLFQKAISDIRKMGAEVVDSIYIDNFNILSQGHWAPAFQFDLNKYLAEQGANIPVRNLKEIIDAGNYSEYIENNLFHHLENSENPENLDPPALDVFTDPRRIEFREAIESVMDELKLDAFIYPSWNYPPARIGHFEEYLGDNNQIVSPHTGQPAFTIPMGYTKSNLPVGLQFLGRMFDEPTLIKLCYSFEQGTKHRKIPNNFSSKND